MEKYNVEQIFNMPFTTDEKKRAYPTALKVVRLLCIIYKYGILALVDEVENETNFIKTIVGLIANGKDPSVLKNMLLQKWQNADFTDMPRFDSTLLVKGLLLIYDMDMTPLKSVGVIGEFMGNGYTDRLCSHLPETIREIDNENSKKEKLSASAVDELLKQFEINVVNFAQLE